MYFAFLESSNDNCSEMIKQHLKVAEKRCAIIKGVFYMYSLEDSNDELNLYKKEHKKLLKALPNKEEIPFFIFGVKNDFNDKI